MKTLLVVATAHEIQPLLDHYGIRSDVAGKALPISENVNVLITGPGMINTTYSLTKKFQLLKPELILNAGIAGSFNRNISIGEVVKVEEEYFGDLGAEDDDVFLSMDEIGLGSNKVVAGKIYYNDKLKRLRSVIGISVNKVHGCEGSIKKVSEKFSADVESMEGAAVMHFCGMEKVSYLQLRSISNYVEKRDKSKWQIPLAIKNLNEFLIDLIPGLK